MTITESRTWPLVDPKIGLVALGGGHKFVPSGNPTILRGNKSVQSAHFYTQSVYNSRCFFTVKCNGSQLEVWLRYCISNAHVSI